MTSKQISKLAIILLLMSFVFGCFEILIYKEIMILPEMTRIANLMICMGSLAIGILISLIAWTERKYEDGLEKSLTALDLYSMTDKPSASEDCLTAIIYLTLYVRKQLKNTGSNQYLMPSLNQFSLVTNQTVEGFRLLEDDSIALLIRGADDKIVELEINSTEMSIIISLANFIAKGESEEIVYDRDYISEITDFLNQHGKEFNIGEYKKIDYTSNGNYIYTLRAVSYKSFGFNLALSEVKKGKTVYFHCRKLSRKQVVEIANTLALI